MTVRVRWGLVVIASAWVGLAAPGCGDGDADSDSDADPAADADLEVDADADADGDGDEDGDADADADADAESGLDADADADPDDAVCSPLPPTGAAWVEPFEAEVLGVLTGVVPAPSGPTLTDRASYGRREAARAYLEGELSELGLAPQRHEYGGGAANVWAELPATTGPAEAAVVLGAHFDTVWGCPGADDDASGVTLVLAVARYLVDVECRSRAVYVVFFDEEELGLVGSAAFAEWLDVEGVDVHSVHTADMVGWDSDDDLAIEIEQAGPGLFELYDAANTAAGLGIPLTETDGGSSDHVAFRDAGFSAVGVTESWTTGDTTPHYHQPTDTFETIDLTYLASTTQLVSLAMADLVSP